MYYRQGTQLERKDPWLGENRTPATEQNYSPAQMESLLLGFKPWFLLDIDKQMQRQCSEKHEII